MLLKSYKIQKLIYRSCYRGIKEIDYLLCDFAKENLKNYSEAELEIYEEFLELKDNDLMDILIKNAEPSPEFSEIIKQINLFNQETKLIK